MVYDIVIVGAGSIGSSAAYHLSQEHPDLTVALIGPGEPAIKDYSRDTFGCHYDEGRITRVSSPFHVEQVLALRSTEQYGKLEKLSDMKIYSEVGFLLYGDDNPSSLLQERVQSFVSSTDDFCKANKIQSHKVTTRTELKDRFPYLESPSEAVTGRFVLEKSGYISIRNLVRATQHVAKASGVDRIEEVATRVSRNVSGTQYEVLLESGETVEGKKVILSCGSFSNFKDLLPRKLDIKLCSHTVMKFELSEEDIKMLEGCPSYVVYAFSDDDYYIYGLPPILYPNGKTYLKIGHTVNPSFQLTKVFTDQTQVQDWYCKTTDDTVISFLKSRFRKIFPGVKPLSEESDFCVMAMTKSGRQYLGFCEPDLFIATGGNGKSAKMALELGKIAARCTVKGEWDYDLPSDSFKIHYVDNNN